MATTSTLPRALDRIPNELLEEIFLMCLDTKAASEPDRAPMLLCQVCHHWRITAMDAPRLWEHLFIPNTGKIKVDPWACANFVLDWTHRARPFLLQVTISDDKLDTKTLKEFWQCLDTLNALERWSTLHLELKSFAMTFRPLVGRRMPNLRVLSLQPYRPIDDRRTHIIDPLDLSLLPAVQEVTSLYGTLALVGGAAQQHTLRVLECPLSGTLGHLLNQLQLLPNIEVLRCIIDVLLGVVDAPGHSAAPIVLGRLHTLAFQSERPGLGPILATLCSPALKDFTIHSCAYWGTEYLLEDTYLTNLIQKSGASLESIDACGCSARDLLGCLKLSRSLKRVSGGRALSELLGGTFTTPSNGGLDMLCPQLEEVTFVVGSVLCFVTKMDAEPLLELVMSRSRFSVPNPVPPHTMHSIVFEPGSSEHRRVPPWVHRVAKAVQEHPLLQEHFERGFAVKIIV